MSERDEANIRQIREFLDGYGRPVGAPEPWRQEIYALWGDLSRAARIAERLQEQNRELVEALEKFTAWNERYPSSRIYGEGDIRRIAGELDVIYDEAHAALAKAREGS